jgi:MFS family permease
MKEKNELIPAILSLSLLTVMAGAAVAPALDVIRAYFSHDDPMLVQMIISVPALFIVLTSFVFPRLCVRFGAKTLVTAGLVLYTAGGCAAGLFSNIWTVLAARALVGIGVGIIMPLSTGLLAFWFPAGEQEKLMGWSSAMNQMGGVVATLLSGALAGISWRASFLVYLLGLGSIVLCLRHLPDEKIRNDAARMSPETIKENAAPAAAMFLLMVTFFVYPSNFAMVSAADGVIPQYLTSVIMASLDMVAFAGGLAFVHLKAAFGDGIRFLSPSLFLAGYLALAFAPAWAGALAGSALIGFANGVGVPYIISSASKKAGRSAASTVMPLLSAALFLAQFLTPAIISAAKHAAGGAAHAPYFAAAVSAALFLLCSQAVRDEKDPAPQRLDEAAGQDNG